MTSSPDAFGFGHPTLYFWLRAWSRFNFANCCLLPSQMNLVFWALRRSRFEDIQSARAPIAWCMVRAAPIAEVVYKSLHGAAPNYLKSYCVGVSTSRVGARLRSEVKGDLKERKSKTCFGERAFSVAGPQCWNNIPTSIRSSSTLESFKSRLKTHSFEKSYLWHAMGFLSSALVMACAVL